MTDREIKNTVYNWMIDHMLRCMIDMWFAVLKKIGGPFVRLGLRIVFALHNNITVKGLENAKLAGDRVIYIANHVSFVDAAILATYIPGNPTFAVNLGASKWWWMQLVMPFFNCVTLDTRNPMAIKALVNLVKDGKPVVIFPEGRLTVTNGLMKVYDGPGMIADKADANIVPIRLEGVHFTPLSRLRGRNPVHYGHPFEMTMLPPRKVNIGQQQCPVCDGDGDIIFASGLYPGDNRRLCERCDGTGHVPMRGKTRRIAIGNWLYDEMVAMMAATDRADQTLYEGLLDASASYGEKTVIAENIDPTIKEITAITYKNFIVGTLVLGRQLSQFTNQGEFIGVLLPNSIKTAVTFFALQAFGRVPAMLNFSTGLRNIQASIRAAEIKTVITSRFFVEQAKLQDVIKGLENGENDSLNGVNVVYLEDIGANIGLIAKLRGKFLDYTDARAIHYDATRPPYSLHDSEDLTAHTPAVVIFTSGSEGVPKGVVLSHKNLLSNMYQLAASVDFSPQDIVLNALPMFHSFGLTAGTLLPFLNGIKVFLFPNPLNYKVIPELVYDRNVTIMFGTDTFLNGYAKQAHPYDFRSIRYIFAGAEKVKDSTRALYMEKFQRAIYEGYGATECAPVIATNTPMHYRSGTVGRLMPLIDYKLVTVPGVEDAFRLIVRGPNVMLGYLKADNPGVIQQPEDGWYDTGDMVSLDDQGFITIRGRAKRFAKIAGEMVSLTAVETQVSALWVQHQHAVVAIKDEKKGEQLVLFTTNPDANRAALAEDAKSKGISALSVPAVIKVVDAIPLLGTGKTDYATIQKMAEA